MKLYYLNILTGTYIQSAYRRAYKRSIKVFVMDN